MINGTGATRPGGRYLWSSHPGHASTTLIRLGERERQAAVGMASVKRPSVPVPARPSPLGSRAAWPRLAQPGGTWRVAAASGEGGQQWWELRAGCSRWRTQGQLPWPETRSSCVDVNAVLSSGWSLLMYAAVCANPALVKVLLARGASAHFATEGGYTVLMAACAPSHRPAGDAVACAAQLLQHALDTNVTDRMGMSAVMYAARDGYQDSVALLGQHSADVNLQDQHGWTVSMRCTGPRSRGHEACRRRLEELGADTAIKTNGGFSAEELALQFSKVQIVLESYKESGACKFMASTNKISAVSTKALELKIRNKLMLDDLKQFLFGLDLGHLVPLFQAQEVTLRNLLTMSDQELSALGAMQTGEQRKILAASHKLHMSRWESGSIPDITKLPVSFEGTMTLLVNMELQCNYMQSSLEYLCKHSVGDLTLLKPVKVDVEYNSTQLLLDQMERGMSAAQALHRQAATLLSSVRECRTDSPTPADFIASKRKRRLVSPGGAAALLMILAGAAGAAVLFAWKRGSAVSGVSVPAARV
ncbi:ankyrin repeat, SAM and basic leucine zipper domain-containing protein 1 [Lethenteron reissneri]|uniref:ankyrin repeat, SAM and basic leucine zipper domain-containing protein 1 n=1 Tax=Lethenteron reissneri TaxID=7753 RepID=UPI002AB70A2C|nr:ankyrin repeat, SAM and basic leucine zipper domain-containing protein 1 [Lethenteron reissneri]